MKVELLTDIKTDDLGVFYKSSSRIEYDAKSPTLHKLHALIYQQGPSYGSVGDKCSYLTHDRLLLLEAAGNVRIARRRKTRRS